MCVLGLVWSDRVCCVGSLQERDALSISRPPLMFMLYYFKKNVDKERPTQSTIID